MRITSRRLHKRGLCKAQNKRRYPDKLSVLIDNADNPRTIRAYRCPFCGDWHGTSKPRPEPTDG